jgi:hypothetical protein
LTTRPTGLEKRAVLLWMPTPDAKPVAARSAGQEGSGWIAVDVRNLELWNRAFPWEGNIGQFAWAIEGTWTLVRTELRSSLPPWDAARLFFRQLFTAEPMRAYSINTLGGPYIFGWPLAAWMAAPLVVGALVGWSRRRRRSQALRWAAGGLVAGFLLGDLPFTHSLAAHAQESGRVSAWRDDLFGERESRFGEDFAQLARAFEDSVPSGARIFIPRERGQRVMGETNWIAVHLHPRYWSVQLKDAEYVFYYYPHDYRYDAASESLAATQGDGPSVRVQVISALSSEMMILKVVHAS